MDALKNEIITTLESCMGTISYMRNAFIKGSSTTGLSTIKDAQALVDKLEQANPEPITPEALEREGWSLSPSAFGRMKFRKGKLAVIIDDSPDLIIAIGMHLMEGCKTVQDLRTLDKLVNGNS